MGSMGTTASLVVALASFVVGAVAAAEPSSERSLVLLVTSGISGRLVDADGVSIAELAGGLHALAEADRAAGRDVAMLDAGRTLAPWAESRRDGGRTVLAALAAAGCRVFAPDPVDLSIGIGAMRSRASEVGFPVLRPYSSTGDADSVLAAAGRLELGSGLVVGVTNRWDPVYSADLTAAGLVGARLVGASGPHGGETLRLVVAHSRARGPSVVDRRLPWQLLEEGSADLVLDPDLGADLVVREERDGREVFLVGRRLEASGAWGVLRLELTLAADDGGWRLVQVEAERVGLPTAVGSDPRLEAAVEAARMAFAQARSRVFPSSAPQGREDVVRFVLRAMRERAHAEIAILNRGALRPVADGLLTTRPLREQAVVRLLSLDEEVVVSELTGAKLLELATISARKPLRADGAQARDALVMVGLEAVIKDSGTAAAKVTSATVNGRTLRPDDRYRVALGSYLAAGGDGYEDLAKLDAEVLTGADGRPLELRDDIVIPRLESSREPFADLTRTPVWRWGADRLAVAFTGVRTDRPAGYDDVADSRARAADSTTLLTEARLRADRELPLWRWENRLDARLGLLDVADAPLQETDDDLRFDSSAVLSLFDLLGGSPYTAYTLDSELRPGHAPDGTDLPRQLEQTIAIGVSWSRRYLPRLRLGVVARDYGPADRPRRFGLVGEGQLLIKPRDRRLGFDLRLLAESLGEGEMRLRRLDLDLRLLVPVSGGLVFTPALNWYLYDDSEIPGIARYLRLSVGLGYSWVTRTPRGD